MRRELQARRALRAGAVQNPESGGAESAAVAATAGEGRGGGPVVRLVQGAAGEGEAQPDDGLAQVVGARCGVGQR